MDVDGQAKGHSQSLMQDVAFAHQCQNPGQAPQRSHGSECEQAVEGRAELVEG